MKLIVSALVALSFLAGAVAPAAAYSGSMIEQLDKEGRGGHGQGLSGSKGYAIKGVVAEARRQECWRVFALCRGHDLGAAARFARVVLAGRITVHHTLASMPFASG